MHFSSLKLGEIYEMFCHLEDLKGFPALFESVGSNHTAIRISTLYYIFQNLALFLKVHQNITIHMIR